MLRLDAKVQPNMANGVSGYAHTMLQSGSQYLQVYFKSWTGTVNGSPPTGGGGGKGAHIHVL